MAIFQQVTHLLMVRQLISTMWLEEMQPKDGNADDGSCCLVAADAVAPIHLSAPAPSHSRRNAPVHAPAPSYTGTTGRKLQDVSCLPLCIISNLKVTCVMLINRALHAGHSQASNDRLIELFCQHAV